MDNLFSSVVRGDISEIWCISKKNRSVIRLSYEDLIHLPKSGERCSGVLVASKGGVGTS
eukprot:UN01392